MAIINIWTLTSYFNSALAQKHSSSLRYLCTISSALAYIDPVLLGKLHLDTFEPNHVYCLKVDEHVISTAKYENQLHLVLTITMDRKSN